MNNNKILMYVCFLGIAYCSIMLAGEIAGSDFVTSPAGLHLPAKRQPTRSRPRARRNNAAEGQVVAGEPIIEQPAIIESIKAPLNRRSETLPAAASPELSQARLASKIVNEEYEEPIEPAEKIPITSTPKQESEEMVFPIAKKKEGIIYLGDYLEPWRGPNEHEMVDIQFENADLIFFINYLAKLFNITFILNDNLSPATGPKLAGNKISFKTHEPLSKQQVWETALTFLEMAGFSAIPTDQPRTYRIMVSVGDQNKPSANKEPLPTFIGVDPSLVPNSESKIRYVYFVENAELATIKSVIDAMRSTSSGPVLAVEPMRALIITDRASNIRALLNIILELDNVTMPETLSVIKLKHADAGKVAELYKQLLQTGEPQQPGYLFRPARKQETTAYFTRNTRVIAEPRSNSLIVLGTREGIRRFEDFVLSVVDKAVDLPFSPLHIHQLRYLKAMDIAAILNSVIRFQANETAAQYGGVRGGEKYFRVDTVVTPETSGNRLIINSSYDDYLKILEILEKMDVEQPQVAIKILVLNVDLTDDRELGAQLRNKACFPEGLTSSTNPVCGGSPCCGPNIFGPNVSFQTSGFGFNGVGTGSGIVENTTNSNVGSGATRLLGNLFSLSQGLAAGNTLVSLGQDMFGIFGILRVLQSFTRTTIIANPFVVATHKYRATISVGETMRVTSAIVSGVGGNVTGFVDLSANLEISLTPQISYNDGLIGLEIQFNLDQFTDSFGDTTRKQIISNTLLANGEVLALGGLIRDSVTDAVSKVPILGDIPIIGYFFKNKAKIFTRDALVVLVSPEIISPHSQDQADSFTQSKINNSKELLRDMREATDPRDPFTRWFFKEPTDKTSAKIDHFVNLQDKYLDESRRIEAAARTGVAIGPLIALNDAPKAIVDTSTVESSKKKSIVDLVPRKQAVGVKA